MKMSLQIFTIVLTGLLSLGTTYITRENGKEVGRWVEKNGQNDIQYIDNDIAKPIPLPEKDNDNSIEAASEPDVPLTSPEPSPPASELNLLQAQKAVPYIEVIKPDPKYGKITVTGSGAFINSSGTFLTNYHVVQGATQITVMRYDEKYKGDHPQPRFSARIVRVYPYHDLAVVNASCESQDYFRFADPESIKVGDEVRAIGNPQGLNVTISKGIISAIRTNKLMHETIESWKRRHWNFNFESESIAEKRFENITWIQTDAAVNPGNSGGPLLNTQNELIGINTSGYGNQDAGLNFASHVKHAIEFAKAFQQYSS